MTNGSSSASLAMYPFDAVRPAYADLWSLVVEACPDLPSQLAWPTDVAATWTDDAVVVKQTCGWPLVSRLGDAVRVLGAFVPTVPLADGHRYRSVIVAGRADVDPSSATCAYNSTDSLSGWVSLLAWSERNGESVRSDGVETGAHRASVDAVRTGRADVASIDAVTFAHLESEQPELVAGVAVIDHGPVVPSLPIVVPATSDDEWVERLRSAFTDAVAAAPATCDVLRIGGFVPLDLDDYRRDLAGFSDR